MREEIEPRKNATPEKVYSKLVDTPIQGDETVDFGFWEPTVQLLRRLGALSVKPLGLGIGASFKQFSVETQVYPTRTVVAMSSKEFFKLSDAMQEPRAFSVMLYAQPYLGFETTNPGACEIGFGPIPDRSTGVDGVELARRYASVLVSVLERRPQLLGLSGRQAALVGDYITAFLTP